MTTYFDKIEAKKKFDRDVIWKTVEGPIREIITKHLEERSEEHFIDLCSRNYTLIKSQDLFEPSPGDRTRVVIVSKYIPEPVIVAVPKTSSFNETHDLVLRCMDSMILWECMEKFTGLTITYFQSSDTSEYPKIKPVRIEYKC